MTLEICSNCGAERSDSFCSQCGQNNRNYQRALPPMVWDLLSEAFDLDARVIKTIRSLLFKPGKLAEEFSNNRRASYVSPFRLYLFVSVAFFFLLSTTTTFDLDNQSALAVTDSDQIQAVEDQQDIEPLLLILSPERQEIVQHILATQPASVRGQLFIAIANGVAEQPELISETWQFIVGQAIDAVYAPATTLSNIVENLPIAMFLLLPVFAGLLKLLYLGSGRYYVEHLVFATHLHSFAYLVYAVLLLLPADTGETDAQTLTSYVDNILWLTLLVYHVVALKRYYTDGWTKTVFKYILQMLVYFVCLVPTSFTAVAIGTLATT